jgi:hypothetical protein
MEAAPLAHCDRPWRRRRGGSREATAGSWNRAVRQGVRLSGHNGGPQPPICFKQQLFAPLGKRCFSSGFPSIHLSRHQIQGPIILIISISPQSQYTVIQRAVQSYEILLDKATFKGAALSTGPRFRQDEKRMVLCASYLWFGLVAAYTAKSLAEPA